ncbi:MAG: coniferyl aldehyde dehydrogenase [Desulfobacteraceae bacterium]|nr:coniferyl aldehyde dehydrogenase [Desulfobacteraceae bacterium]
MKTEKKAQSIFERQKKAYLKQPYIHYEQRLNILKTIEKILQNNDEKICEAICTDFGNRSHHETKILEITSSVLGLRYTRKQLKKWMKTQNRHTSLVFFGGKNKIIPQAKGIVGIITPWNYPLFLAIGPLTSAVAAGNRVMIKQAAHSQNLCQLLQKEFSKVISEDLIAFLPQVPSKDFSSLPFDHLIFTGSPEVGKTIMKTAANNLTPVTLELGGKSPTIIAKDFDLKTAVKRIMYAKLINSGQTCVAPDYMFIPKDREEEFIKIAKAIVFKRYPELETQDYTSIINQKAYSRLMATIEDAREKKAEIINLIPGAQADEKLQKISPTIVRSVNEEMTIMQDEIFGPLLPVMTYQSADEVISYINRHERPLALYAFSNDQKFLKKLIKNTMSGGVTINDCAMHVAQHDLPFGGVGNSGMGQYHGYEGFVEFSKLRPIFKQARKTLAITPPYGLTFDRIYKLVKKIKWLA